MEMEQEKVDQLTDESIRDGAEKVLRLPSESQAPKTPRTAVVRPVAKETTPVKMETTVTPTQLPPRREGCISPIVLINNF